jgi:sec-independent protein translocase protein TatA
MPGFVGLPELLLLGLVLLIIFGPKRLPELGRSLGHGMREFKDSVTHDKDEARFDIPVALTGETHTATVQIHEQELMAVPTLDADPVDHSPKVA